MATASKKTDDKAEEFHMLETADKTAGEKTAGVASLMIFGRFVALILSGIAFIVVARVLGPSTYGVYTLAISFAGFFGLGFGDLGVSTTLSKFVGQYSLSKEKEDIERVISAGYLTVLVSGAIFTLVAFVLSGYIATNLIGNAAQTSVIQLVSFAIITAMLYAVSYYTMVGFGKGNYVALVIILQAIAQSVLSIGLALMGFGAIAPIIGVIVGYIVAVLTTLAILSMKFKIRFKMPTFGYIKKLLAFSSPISVYNGLRAFITNLSPIVLAIFATTVIVGNFGVALRTSTIISNVTDALGIAVLPMFAYTVYNKSLSKSISELFNFAAYLTFVLVTPALLYLAILAKQFSYTVFSAQYLYAPIYISIISVGTFLWVIATYTNMLLVGSDKVRELLKYGIIMVCIELVLLFTIIPIFGGLGLVTMLFIITPSLISFFFLRSIKSNLGIKLDIKRLIFVLLSGLISAAFLIPLILIFSSNYALVLVSGAIEQMLLYPMMLVFTGAARRDDLERFKNVTKSIPAINTTIAYLVRYAEFFIRRN